MMLKDLLVALNSEYESRIQEQGRIRFEQISEMCKEAASGGDRFICISESLPPVTKQLLINEGLTVNEQSYRNETTTEIGWM